MEELLRDKVCVLREKIKSSRDGTALYRELSDLLLRAGKISAAMNILEKSFECEAAAEAAGPEAAGAEAAGAEATGLDRHSQDLQGPQGPEGKWLFDRGLEFADAYLYEDAVECFLQAMGSGYDTFDAHYCLAGVYKSLERYPDAEAQCRRAVELNPRFAPAFILLGALLKKPGRLEDSIAACKKAVLIDPDCTAAYYDLACYYSLLAKREQSLAAMEMAFCKGFSDFEWVLKDPDLEALRQNPEFMLLMKSYRPNKS
jgi:tetratricopeptide (TPR) repeat protein